MKNNTLVNSLFYLLGVVIFVFLTCLYLKHAKTNPFFIDEYYFIQKSFYYQLYFKDRNYNDIRFHETEAPLQPKVGPYLYGAFIDLKTPDNIEDYLIANGFTSPEVGDGWRNAMWDKKLPDFPKELNSAVDLIVYSRKVATFFLLLSLLTIYLIVNKIYGKFTAFLTLFMAGINVLVIYAGVLATTDTMLLFFSMASLFSLMQLNTYIENYNTKKIILHCVLLGLLSALATGVKISGILVLLFLVTYLSILFSSLLLRRKSISQVLVSLHLIIISFFTIFIILHPYLYRDTFNRIPKMFVSRYEGTELAQLEYPGTKVSSKKEAFKIVFKETLLPGGKYLNFGNTTIPFDLILFLTGTIMLFRKSYKNYLQRKNIDNNLIILLWFLIMFSGLVLYLKNNWARYFLESVIAISIIQSIALSGFYLKAYRYILKKVN